MLRFRFILCILLGVLSASAAQAEEFYIELGRANSEAEANQLWTGLQQKNKILNAYTMYPNAILLSDGSFSYRVQAGPMQEKAQAERVCSRLFRKKINCFVIEGFDPQNAKSFDKPKELPPEAAPVSKGDFLPWLFSAPAPAPEPVAEAVIPEPEPVVAEIVKAPPVEVKTQPKVEVAEAIPVPLSDMKPNDSVSIAEPVQIASFDDAPAPQPVKQQPGWLNVQPFLDANKANEFWRDLKNFAPDATRRLNTRVITPVVSHDIPKVLLSVGSFASESEALQFCTNFVLPASNYLECQFTTNQVASEAAPVQGGGNGAEEEEYSLFWVEVLDEKSQNAAFAKWEGIRTDNDDLLSQVRSQIVSPLDRESHFVVRIGPLNMRSKANKLCKALAGRGVGCKVVTL